MLKFYLSLFLLCPILLTAQNSNVEEIAVRFKTGLNFAQILGPAESVNGEEAEEYSFRTGFHVSGGIDYAWSEKWGARAMIGYSQKGSAFDFDGPSYLQFINPATNLPLFSVGGNRRMTLNITNSFIELPLSAYGRFGRVEVELGATIGYLITSRADGELTYSNVSDGVEALTIPLDHDYYGDSFELPVDKEEVFFRTVNGASAEIPTTLNAYYESVNTDENRYNGLDVSLQANVAFFLNRGLFISFGAQYSVLDATNDMQDFSLVDLGEDGGLRPTTDDNDYYLVLQMSIGFKF